MPLPLRAVFGFVPLAGLAACGGASTPPSSPPETATEVVASAEPAKVSAPKAPVAAPEKSPSERGPESIVQLSFEPLVMGVRPGGRLLLAAHLRIAPGYRISWKAAGDVGKPTTVTFTAPAGFEVGPVQFPAPDRYTLPGGYVGLGYENETAVFVEVKAPPGVRRDDVSRFDVDASWVACKRICASERTSAFVELATTYGDARAKDVESSVAPFRARLPKPLTQLKDAEAKWEPPSRDATLLVKLPGAAPKDFFSDGAANPKPKKTALAAGEIRFVYDEPPRPGSTPLRGVIAATIEGKDAFFELEAPLPGDDDEASKAPKDKPSTEKAKKAAKGARKALRSPRR